MRTGRKRSVSMTDDPIVKCCGEEWDSDVFTRCPICKRELKPHPHTMAVALVQYDKVRYSRGDHIIRTQRV